MNTTAQHQVNSVDRNTLSTDLLSWVELSSRQNFQNSFTTLLTVFGESIATVAMLNIKQLLDEEIADKKKELAVGIEDYGLWRSTRGNPGFGVYSAARRGESEEISRLTRAGKYIALLSKSISELAAQFGSIEKLAMAFELYRSVTQGMLHHSWGNGINYFATLTARDISLCMAWNGTSTLFQSIEKVKIDMLQSLDNYNACRLLSARAAEIAAQSYYRGLGFAVVDISAGQIDESDVRWKDCDLSANQFLLDVKNARKSFTSSNSYVEHCVPKFKLDRQTGNEVSIVGVLSEYESNVDSIIAGIRPCKMLGQVNVTEIRQLYRWVRARFGGVLNIDGIWNTDFLPGWIFEYPDEQYEERNHLLYNAEKLLDLFDNSNVTTTLELPRWLLALQPGHPVIQKLKLPLLQKKLLNDLASLATTVSLKRPSLYVYAMGALLEAVLKLENFSETAEALCQILFVNPEKTITLGLVDTQDYIANLVQMIVRVGEEANHQGIQFKAFKMPHPAILKGQCRDGQWISLIAYCGGWRESPYRVKCGASPLFFGKHEICSLCGRLVCNACSYCSEACDFYYQRKKTRETEDGFKK